MSIRGRTHINKNGCKERNIELHKKDKKLYITDIFIAQGRASPDDS